MAKVSRLKLRAALALALASLAPRGGVAVRFEVEAADGDVLVLDEANFDATIAEHEAGILVEFYAPWCGHCQKLAPEYKKAASRLLEETGGKARLAMVDATEEKALAERFEIRGFPALKLFKGGDPDKPSEYGGGRTERDIVAYMKKATGPAATLLVDGDAFAKLPAFTQATQAAASSASSSSSSHGAVVLGFFADENSEVGRLFHAVASLVEGLECFHSPDPDLAHLHASALETNLNQAKAKAQAKAGGGGGGGGDPVVDYDACAANAAGRGDAVPLDSIVVLKSFDGGRSVRALSSSSSSAEEVAAWVGAMAVPKLLEFKPEFTKTLFQGPIKSHVLTFLDPKAPYFSELQQRLATLAEDHRDQLLHVWVPSTEERVLSYFMGSGDKAKVKEKLPYTVIADVAAPGNLKKYLFTGTKAHTLAELRSFEAAYLAGDLKPFLKSEEPKPSDLKGKVKVAVGSGFEADVLGSGRDALVMFHAPWCGHCKALSPKWDDLGEALAKGGEDAVWVVKMDATANEVAIDGVNLKGFPSIYFFPSGGKPLVYEGGREVSDFLAFLAEHATKPFELEDGTKAKGKQPNDEL